jgi:group I intron endonuclease
MTGIYKITNPNNKVYIGQSTNIENRFDVYIKYTSKIKSQVKLYNSIKKYGPDSHTFEIIEICEINKLNERERYYQDFYNVLNPEIGLNCRLTNSNDKTGKLSEETKEKIRKYNLGKSCKEETKEKIRKKNKGRIHSKETRDKVSKNHSRHNVLLTDNDVIIICEIYKNNGTTKMVKEKYPFLKDCMLSQLRRGKTYKHITLDYNLQKPSKNGIVIKCKKVLCIEDDMIFNGIKETASYYNVSFQTISAIINKTIKKPKINKTFEYI